MGKWRLVILNILLLFIAAQAVALDKKNYYKALSSGSEAIIDDMIKQLEQEKPSSLVSAYHGAILMKKAGFVKGVKGKVSTFKKGAEILEKEIGKHTSNPEYRFLRLTVQEHAPGILKYNKDLEEDKKMIVNSYGKLDTVLKEIISDYAQDSKILNELKSK